MRVEKLSRMGLFAAGALSLVVATACGSGSNSSSGGAGGQTAALQKCDTQPGEVLIGATLPLSGSGAPYGSMFQKSLQLGIDEVNAAGGINGKTKLKLKALDDQGLAGPAVQQMRQLVTQDKAIAVVSAYNDPPLAQATVAAQLKTPVLNGGGNAVKLSGKPWVWNNVANIAQESQRIQQYAKDKLGTKRIGLLVATNYTTDDIAAVTANAQKLFGSGNVKVVKFDPEVTDVKPQLQQLKAFKPDAIDLMNSGTLTVTAAKNASELNLGIPFLGTSGTLYEPGILKQPSMRDATASAMTFDPKPDFVQKAKAKTGVDANAFIDNYASMMKVVQQAGDELAKGGYCINGANLNAKIKEHAEANKPFQGFAGPVAYKPDGASARELKVIKATNGKIVEVDAGQPPASA